MLTLPLRFQAPPTFVRALPDTREKASPPSYGTWDPFTGEDKRENSGPFRKSVRDKARKDHEFSGQR
jgi:hypothetical protein